MNLNPDTVIIAIPGETETRELTFPVAREAIERGEIAPNFWAWSSAHQAWKPISEVLELEDLSRTKSSAVLPSVPEPGKPESGRSLVVKEEVKFSFFRILVVLLGIAVAGMGFGNYFYVDQPLTSKLASTSFAAVPVHAHLGAFFQTNALVIHLLPTKEVNADNFADFLVTLAGSTPPQPFDQTPFRTVGLTSEWVSQYIIPGTVWQSLGQMTKATEAEKKDFILTHLAYTSGTPLLSTTNITDPDAAAKYKDKVWQELLAGLVPDHA